MASVKFKLLVVMAGVILPILAGCAGAAPPTPAAPSASGPASAPAGVQLPTAMPSPTAAMSQKPEQSTIVSALHREPTNLNPIFMDFYAGNWKSFNGLIAYDKDLNLVPDLAAQLPTTSQDGRTVTVRLRKDVHFHDGQPLTAADVVFTWRAMLDPQVATPLRGRFDLSNVVADVRELDTHTVQFDLKRGDASFIHKLVVGIAPKHLLQGQNLKTAQFNQSPVGTGPYIFKEWRPGERIVMEANPSYFKGKVGVQRLVYTFVEDENARVALLASGSIDAAGLPPKLAARFRSDPRYQVVEVPSADTRIVTLPRKNPALADPRVRRAMAMAVDRKAIVQGVLGGGGRAGLRAFHPGRAGTGATL